MVRNMFGTDGIRGAANAGHIVAETLIRIGMALGRVDPGNNRISVVIGKDTRLSGYMIEPALTSGLVSVGVDPILVGPLPTPAIAMLTRSLRADFGVMITASHNPFHDNGIKVFNKSGAKICNTVQRRIEDMVAGTEPIILVEAKEFGRVRRLDDAQGRYIEHAKNTLAHGIRFDGMRIVLDCAHGAGYRVAPTIFRELGAEVITLGCDPNGVNINKSVGATHSQTMRARVLLENADLGIALDGDADRVIIADEQGALIDGDQILAVLAEQWKLEGKLSRNGIVATEMSNHGLEHFLNSAGLELERAGVGDRSVAEKMRAGGYNLGGEQSGHIISGSQATTGDGITTALQVMQVIKKTGRSASIACRKFTPTPQILHNVKIQDPDILDNADVRNIIGEVEQQLNGIARIMVRKSGTEPVVRIMGEGENSCAIRKSIDRIAGVIENAA